MDMSALTFFSWAIMSAESWSFLVAGIVVLVVGSVGRRSRDWLTGGWLTGGDGSVGGWLADGVGSGGLGLAIRVAGLVAGAVGLYTLPDHVTSAHISAA